MKKLLFLAICLTTCIFSNAQDVKVGADKSFNESLNGYNTFGWSSELNQIPTDAIFIGNNGVYVFNNESTRSRIKDAIQYELNAKGYREAQGNPDIIVLFRVTENAGRLRTFNGYETYDNGQDSARTADNVETVDILPGTLLINLVDAKSGKVAWQGYASGLLKADMINDDVKVREAVASIFKKFEFQAKR